MQTYPLLLVILASTLFGCATRDAPPAPEADMADARLGPEVDRLCFASGISGFREASDRSIILTRGTKDYLVTTRTRCRDLDVAMSIAIDSYTACLSRGDKLVGYDSAFGPEPGPPSFPCYVDRIYKWDEDAKAAPPEPATASTDMEN